MSRLPLSADAFLTHLDRICVAVADRTPAELQHLAEATIVAGSRFIELRLDALDVPEDCIARTAELVRKHPETVTLATCRRIAGGGFFSGSVAEQLRLLAACAAAGARLIDVELETLEVAAPATLAWLAEQLQVAGAAALVSAHDYASTGDLHATLNRLQTLGAPLRPIIYKVVSTATCLADNLRMLRFLSDASRHTPVVGMCMGEAGVPSRVLAVRAGSLFTFAAADGEPGTAPGQLVATRMREEFRVGVLGPATKLYGVAGNPVTHSLSPAMHNAAFHEARVDAVYLPLHTTTVEDLWQFVQGLPLDGLSVTMPWKTAVLPLLDAVEPAAARVGAVNTVVRRADGTLLGVNTDVPAIVEPIAERMPLPGTRVLVLGAGGAARAAVFGLRAAGAEVAILNRSVPAAEALAQESGSSVADPATLHGYAILVNTTPAGMAGPLQDMLAVDATALEDARLVFETVYRPAETPLTRLARSRSIPVIAGSEMFLRQGMQQWELWTGRQAPRARMLAVLSRALEPEAAPRRGQEERDDG